MKKKSLLLLSALFAVSSIHADEGMWTLFDLPKAVYEQMKAEGYNLPYNSLYQDDNAVMKAVVNFSGFCSGVVASPNGLVFTNHHCGFGAINKLSSVEHDYMKDGFVAQSYEQELPAADTYVSFMVSQTDITDQLLAQQFDKKTREEQAKLIDELEKKLDEMAKKDNPTYHVEVRAFYERNKYYATTYQDFTDVRLVFTVPKSMGKFGGETDNWMWPRQTCDFSVFRIYADPKTNGPAPYSKDNVPYRPKHWAPVSLDGYQEGSFSMTMGYPGSTSRYISSYGIQERRDAINEPRAQVRGVKQEIMMKHMRQSEATRIKYETAYAQSANYWKNSIGMNKCIDSIGIVFQKQQYETKIKLWQYQTGEMKGKLDFDKLKELYQQRSNFMRVALYWSETFRRTSEFNNRALRLVAAQKDYLANRKKSDRYYTFADNSDKWDAALDKEVMAALLDNYRQHVDAAYLPAFYNVIDKEYKGNYAAFVDKLYSSSILMQSGKKIDLSKKSLNKDLGVVYATQLLNIINDLYDKIDPLTLAIDDQEKMLCAAKLSMESQLPHYSDANFTMRLSYGQVGGFELGGKPSGYYTTASSIVEKMNLADKIVDYEAQPIMKQLMEQADKSPYADPKTGKMQLCFLTNNDITGGNSGSPMFNGKGQLIGLAFDGNWDSLSSDINFDARLARCIGLDVRYMLFMMDKWGKAERLIKEIAPVKSAQ